MITDIQELVYICKEELIARGYSSDYIKNINTEWNHIVAWLKESNITKFDKQVGFAYCQDRFGTYELNDTIAKKNAQKLRAIRLLISYQCDGDFESRTPTPIRQFSGKVGEHMILYLALIKKKYQLAHNTMIYKERYLFNFNEYLNENTLDLDDITITTFSDFYDNGNMHLPSKYRSTSVLKAYFKFAFDDGFTKTDLSIYLLPVKQEHKKLVTTYTEEEIRKVIMSVDRSSAIGKRDYLILLLASSYGWRSSDITNFSLKHIDWDKNIISFNQTKTKHPTTFPLLSSVGNAIIDYLKNGRPKTDEDIIILSASFSRVGKKLSPSTIYSAIAKYINKTSIAGLGQKQRGAHALRHSLASNLLKKNVSIPIISVVLGHQNIETTKTYVSIDIDKLRECPLPMPKMKSEFFIGGDDNV